MCEIGAKEGVMKEVSYTEAIRKKYPEHIAWAVSWDEKNQRPDIIVLGWAMPASHNPPMWAISVGETRYSFGLIEQTGEFVLAFPSAAMSDATMLCGTKTGRDINKIAEAALKTAPAAKIKPPLIEGCPACFECVVVRSMVSGDHTIFAADVVASHISEDDSIQRLYNWGGVFKPAIRP